MASMEYIFNLNTSREKDKEEFYKFMNDNLQDFFSNVGNVRFNVPERLVRSVVIPNGANRKLFSELSRIMDMGQVNSSHYTLHKQQIALMLIDESKGSYYKLINNIKKFIRDFNKEDYQFNVVKYSYEDRYSKIKHYL